MKFRSKRYRDAYVAANLRQFLAKQMRAFRGNRSQADFGLVLGQTQSVVSRYEDPGYGKWTFQTLLDVAHKLDVAVIVKFVDFATFIRESEDVSNVTMAPAAYSADVVEGSFDATWQTINVKLTTPSDDSRFDSLLDHIHNPSTAARVADNYQMSEAVH